MLTYLKKYWFFLGIAVVAALSFFSPEAGKLIRTYDILDKGIFLAFFITGLTLNTRAAWLELRSFKVLFASLVSTFVLFPLLAYVLARLTLPIDFVVGVCILATAPVTIASGTVLTALARGNVPLSLFICVLSNLVAIFTIPISLHILVKTAATIDLPVAAMVTGLLLKVLLPTVAGQILRPFIYKKLPLFKKFFSIFNQCIVLLIIFNAISSSTSRIKETGSILFLILAVMFVLHSLVLFMNFYLSRAIKLPRPAVSAFTIHVSQKTLTIPYLVWSGYFAITYPVALIPAIGYHLVQMIMDTVVAERFKQAAEKEDR